MNEATRSNGLQRAAPVHLWIVGSVTLLWNAMGVFSFLAARFRLDAYMAQFSAAEQAYFLGLPGWVVVAWALGVFGAFLGSVFLLLRRRWAVGLFALALAGILLNTLHAYALSDGGEILGTSGLVFTVVLILVAVFCLQYSRSMSRQAVLR